MRKLLKKLESLAKEMAEERGGLDLLALFLRADAPNVWDLLVAAPWVDADKGSAIDYVARKLRARLSVSDMRHLSRIVPIDQSNPGLDDLRREVQARNGSSKISDCTLFGLDIEQAHIITLNGRSEAGGRRATTGTK